MAQVEKLDYKLDLEDALLTLAPDGPLDAPPTWSATDNADGSAVSVEVDTTGGALRAIVRLPVNVAMFDYTVMATAPVDDQATPEIESVTSVFHIAGAHSKATDLGGSAGTVAKGAGFP